MSKRVRLDRQMGHRYGRSPIDLASLHRCARSRMCAFGSLVGFREGVWNARVEPWEGTMVGPSGPREQGGEGGRVESVLFVCSGNTCRSVMAEALMRKILRDRGLGVATQVGSAGLHAVEGAPAAEAAREVLRERGVDLGPHRARQLTAAMVEHAGWIVTMTAALRDEARSRYPEKADRIVSLGDLAGTGADVPDPYGLPLERYRETAGLLEDSLPWVITLLEG